CVRQLLRCSLTQLCCARCAPRRFLRLERLDAKRPRRFALGWPFGLSPTFFISLLGFDSATVKLV
ncbi:MAG TPA: hypothetical protein VIN01_09120, partial [Candidatus Dormibacteraeota bacterium]